MKNFRIYLGGLVTLIAWAAFALPVRAQFICHVRQGTWQDTNEFWYSGLLCNGNNCYASAIGGPYLIGPNTHLVFLRSSDGGYTWNFYDPGFSGSWPMPYITSFDRIDSLNIVAYGDSDIVFRTNDGGVTWLKHTIPSKQFITDLNFSTPMSGFIVTTRTVDTIFIVNTILTTSDGGNHWDTTELPFTAAGGIGQCHDYGQGKDRLFEYYYGQVYTSVDNWKTIDSTKPIISDSTKSPYYGFGHCSFGLGDTIFAYGNYFNYKFTPFPLIARTTNGGHDWTIVYNDSVNLVGSVHALSDINRDTIVAGVSDGPGSVLLSTDRGATWKIEPIVCSDTGFTPATNAGIGLNSEGDLVGSYALGRIGSSLIFGQLAGSQVQLNEGSSDEQLFPNPASSALILTGLGIGQTIHLLDILGRNVLSATVPTSGSLRLAVSQLPRGMYMVTVDEHGTMVPAGRVILN